MPSLSFNAMFADRVERGEKLHSIRGRRKRPEQWLPGKKLHLFTAMRTRHCRRLGLAIITSVHEIDIVQTGVEIDGAYIDDPAALSAFARADGFLTWSAFVAFFEEIYGLPWRGSLIKWQFVNPDSPHAQEGSTP